jgi:phage terminase large subunit GpA-like protein
LGSVGYTTSEASKPAALERDFVWPQADGGQSGRREVNMGEIQCPRCEETFITEWHEVRFRAGSFYDAERDESFKELCEDCHREVTDK